MVALPRAGGHPANLRGADRSGGAFVRPARRLTRMSGLQSRSVPAPGQAPLVAPNAAALLRRNAAEHRRPRRHQVRRPDVDARRVLRGVVPLRQPVRRTPARRRPPARRGAARQHPRLPLRVRRRGPDRRRRRRPQPHPARRAPAPRRRAHALRAGDHRAAPRGAAGADRRRTAAGAHVDPVRRRRRSRLDARGVARRRARRLEADDPGHEPDVDAIWALIFTSGTSRRAEGGDLLATPAARHRQPHADDHGPRARRRRLRVHAAVPLERGAGRLGAVARDAVRGRARPAVLGVAAGCPTSAATARPTSTTRASRSRTCSRNPSSPTTPTTRCGSRSATRAHPRSSRRSRVASGSR